jgi:hypothetical protein
MSLTVDIKELIERQKNEVCALQSIFGSYFFDLREKENTNQLDNSYIPPLIRITLFPQNSESQLLLLNENLVQIDFKIKCSINYPNEYIKLDLILLVLGSLILFLDYRSFF